MPDPCEHLSWTGESPTPESPNKVWICDGCGIRKSSGELEAERTRGLTRRQLFACQCGRSVSLVLGRFRWHLLPDSDDWCEWSGNTPEELRRWRMRGTLGEL